MAASVGVGGIALGGSLLAVGLVISAAWVIAAGALLMVASGLVAFNLGPAY